MYIGLWIHPPPPATLDPEIHRRVCDEVDRDTALLEHRIPRHMRCVNIVRGIELETARLQAHLSELLKHVDEDEYVDYSSGGIIS